jgi:23S rRNA (uracil747-C5)-methyltransferase
MINCEAYDSNRCKSCGLIKLSYEDGLNQKIELVQKIFPTIIFSDTIKSHKLVGYRNKAKFVVGGDIAGPILGIPSPGNKLLVSPLTDCQLHTESINQIAISALSGIREFNLTPYSIATKTGEFKYLIISEGHKTADISIRFGMRSLEAQARVEKLFKKLKLSFPTIKVCTFEIQSEHAAIFSGKEIFLSEDKFIQYDFEDIQLSSSSSNFVQVNSLIAKQLYETVFERMKNEQIQVGVDLFCGVGGFAQQLSRFSEKVYGIEIDDVAIECAKYSTKLNNIKNIVFICDDAKNFKQHIKSDIDLIVVNPPRRGLGKGLSLLLSEMNSKYIVYSSCNAKSLAADLNVIGSSYEVESITPVDMFPLTNHLEVLCILKQKNRT